MTLSIWNLYIEISNLTHDWTFLIKPLEIFSIILVTIAFLNRKHNSQKHKEYMLFGTFCLIGPALDRTVLHLFGPENMIWPMIIMYWLLFGLFIWYKKQFTWYMGVWVCFWSYSLFPLFIEML